MAIEYRYAEEPALASIQKISGLPQESSGINHSGNPH
jgi:hypothetical protein